MLVLNATYEPINVCTVRRATVLLLKEKAEVIEIGSQTLHWANGSLAKPVVITEDGGKSGTATVTYAKPGTYKFLCSQPGHDQLGMHGTITVQ